MADLSGYTPIYVRTNGDDVAGDGSVNFPFLTAQKAFEVAYAGTGNKVLDFGAGNFGGVNLNTAGAAEWPGRINVRGSGSTQSFLGGLDASGESSVADYNTMTMLSEAQPGKNIDITSDKTIDVGAIVTTGGSVQWEVAQNEGGKSGGSVTLTDCISVGIIASGGGSDTYVDPNNNIAVGGNIILTNSSVGDITTDGGGDQMGVGTRRGGNVSLVESVAGNISALGGPAGGGSGIQPDIDGGDVTLVRSVVNDINASGGGSFGNTFDNYSSGSGGNVSLTGSIANNVAAMGGLAAFDNGYGYYNGLYGGQGGSISLVNSLVNEIDASGAAGANGGGYGGEVVLTSSRIMSATAAGGSHPNANYLASSGAGGEISVTDSYVESELNASPGDCPPESIRGAQGLITFVGDSVLPALIVGSAINLTDLATSQNANGSGMLGI